MKINIVDNFLDNKSFIDLQKTLLGNSFPWFYNDSKVYKYYKTPIKGYEMKDLHQFTHTFLDNEKNLSWSNYSSNIESLLNKIKCRLWTRVKANLSSITTKPLVAGWHCDQGDEDGAWKDTTTSIFYVNTNNGYTMFENKKKVESVGNRLVTFPNYIKHTGVSQTNTKIRVTLNLNYLAKQ